MFTLLWFVYVQFTYVCSCEKTAAFVCPHGTASLPQVGFSQNLMLEIFFKILPIRFSVYEFFFWQSTRNEQQPVRATYQPYHCNVCSISFKNQLFLKRHQDTHHAQRPFVCKSCHKIFIRKGILHLHLRLHSEDRPFYCAACNSKLRRADGVKTICCWILL